MNNQTQKPLVSTIFEFTSIQLYCKYNSTSLTYLIKKIDELIFNDPTIYSAIFKEYLLYQDTSEFLRRFYSSSELPHKLKHILSFYHKYSRIYPNYTIMESSKYLYKNIQKKQKMIDNLQEIKRQENYNKAHPSNIQNILSSSALGIISNESNSFYTKNIDSLFNISSHKRHKHINEDESLNNIEKIINVIDNIEDHMKLHIRSISPEVPKHNNLILKQDITKTKLNNNNNNPFNLHLLYKSSSLSNIGINYIKRNNNLFNQNNINNSSSNNSRSNNSNKIKLFSPRYVQHKPTEKKEYLIKNKLVLHHKLSSQTHFPSPQHIHKPIHNRNAFSNNSIDNDTNNTKHFYIKRSGVTEHSKTLRMTSSILSSPSATTNKNNSAEHKGGNYNRNNNAIMISTSSFNKNRSTLNICKIKTPKNDFLTERYNANKKFLYIYNDRNNRNKQNVKKNLLKNGISEFSPISKMKKKIVTLSGNNSIKNCNRGNTGKKDFMEVIKEELKNKFKLQNFRNVVRNMYVQYN